MQDGTHRGKRCPCVRRVKIGDKYLCKRHSAMEALFIMLREGRAKRIIQRAPRDIGAVAVGGLRLGAFFHDELNPESVPVEGTNK